MITLLSFHLGMVMHYSVSFIKWSVISSLSNERVVIPSLHSISSMILSIPNQVHTCPQLRKTLGKRSKYTNPHLESIEISGLRISSISIAWELLMTYYHVIFSWMDRSNTIFSNVYLCLWLIYLYPMTP